MFQDLNATSDNDVLVGGNNTSYIFGLDGDDQFIGSNEDEFIDGGSGNDMINGGFGKDIANFSGNKTDYEYVLVKGGLQVVDKRDNSPDGIDTLYNIEELSFADGTRTIDNALVIHSPLELEVITSFGTDNQDISYLDSSATNESILIPWSSEINETWQLNLTKLDFNGQTKWNKSFGYGNHITSATDNQNNIYIACSGDSQNSSFITKLDQDGNEKWKLFLESRDDIYDLKVVGDKLFIAGSTYEDKDGLYKSLSINDGSIIWERIKDGKISGFLDIETDKSGLYFSTS